MQEAKKKTSSEWQYKPEVSSGQAHDHPADLHTDSSVSWTASEFIANQKNASWFIFLGLAIAVACIIIYFFTRDILTTIMIALIASALGYFGARQPRVLQYKVDNIGIHIGSKLYSYHLFKSFSVLDEGAVSSILFMPLKRFMPPISAYYAPDDEEKIVEVLGDYLPFEHRSHDLVDRLMHKIRF